MHACRQVGSIQRQNVESLDWLYALELCCAAPRASVDRTKTWRSLEPGRRRVCGARPGPLPGTGTGSEESVPFGSLPLYMWYYRQFTASLSVPFET